MDLITCLLLLLWLLLLFIIIIVVVLAVIFNTIIANVINFPVLPTLVPCVLSV